MKTNTTFFLDVPLGKAQMVPVFYKLKVFFNQLLNYAMNRLRLLYREVPWVCYKVTLLA